MNNDYLELENLELQITPSSLGIMNNSQLLNDHLKKENERNNFCPSQTLESARNQCNPKRHKTTRSLRSFPTACKVACQSLEMFDTCLLFKFDLSCVFQPVPGSQIVTGKAREYGKGAKEWGRRESERRTQPLLSSVSSLFCVRAFSIPRARLSRSLEQAISLQLTPTAFSWQFGRFS